MKQFFSLKCQIVLQKKLPDLSIIQARHEIARLFEENPRRIVLLIDEQIEARADHRPDNIRLHTAHVILLVQEQTEFKLSARHNC